ncbi:MAG: MoaD/ThiS family protein [Chloroflexi bacterium]|nr:MoaD/ThiS family protein [Chloroflexota bacterium]
MVEDQRQRQAPRRPRDIKSGEGAAVRLVQLGKAIQSFRVPEGGTLEQALSMGDIATRGGMDIRVNGKKVALTYALQDGDLITVVPFIRGGVAAGPVRVKIYMDYL